MYAILKENKALKDLNLSSFLKIHQITYKKNFSMIYCIIFLKFIGLTSVFCYSEGTTEKLTFHTLSR